MKIEFHGAKDIEHALTKVMPKVAHNIARSTVHGVAGDIAKQVKKNSKAFEDSGDLRKAIGTKRRRAKNGEVRSDVVVNKKKGGWYWHFKEFGTVNQSAHPFVRPAFNSVWSNIDNILRTQFGKKFAAALKREAKKNK